MDVTARRPGSRVIIISILVVSCSSHDEFQTPRRPIAEVGSRFAEVGFKDLQGGIHNAETFSSSKAVVLAWTGLGCPMSKVYEPRLKAIAKEYSPRGIRFFLINSNVQDGVAEMESHLEANPPGFPVVRDQDGGLARRFGIQRTTEVVVLDSSRVIRYRGAVDDQYGFRRAEGSGVGAFRRAEPAKHYLRRALESILSGREVNPKSTEAYGCALGLATAPADGGAAKLTFHEHVEIIIQKHCQVCHHKGGRSPFALTEYEDVQGWAAMIQEVVVDRRMPPWNADPAYGKFRNNRSLSPETIDIIRSWVEAGAPRGDPRSAPPARTWRTDHEELGEPDIVYTTPAFQVPAEGRVPYRYVRMRTDFKEDRWIRAAKFESTSPELVHHTLTFMEVDPRVRPSTARPWVPLFNPLDLLEGADPKDYRKWIRRNRKLLPQLTIGKSAGLNGYFLADLPGDGLVVYPDGRGKLLPAAGTLVYQIHYTPDGTARESQTSVLLWLSEEAPAEPLDVRAATTVVFAIPPGDADYQVEATYEFQRGGKLLALRPHMHLRGKSFRFRAEYPDGSRETLLHVPDYDFDWQFEYVLAEPKYLPKGTRLRALGTFDNSETNPDNPDPGRKVYFGVQSDEEMFIGYFEVIWDSVETPSN